MSTTDTARSPKESDDLFAAAQARSVLVPLNRETAIAVLGGFCVSDVPAADVSIPVQGRGLALLDDGLRSSEAELVSGGDARRFPVLLEFPSSSVRKAVSGECAIGLSQLARIIFRNSTEADDFRFRPFDELDTEALPHSVEPEKFDLAGEARFKMKAPDHSNGLAVFVDRFAAGVHNVLALAEIYAPTRGAAVDFFQQQAVSEQPGLQGCWRALAADADGAESGVLSSVVRAFASGQSRPDIIDRISRQLALSNEKAARAWGEIARSILQNRTQLTGEQLSDGKSIPLRAALLALSADTPAAIVAFLKSERPPGERVAVAASFLVGMKTGVLSLGWAQKKNHIERLSSLTTVLLVCAITDRESAAGAIAVKSDAQLTTVLCDGELISKWTSPQRPADKTVSPLPQVLVEGLQGVLVAEGYVLEGAANEPGSYRFALNGRSVTIFPALDDQDPSCVLMFVLDADSKLRKKSEVAGTFSSPGMLWRPGPLEAAQKFVFCELPRLPQRADAPVLASKLEAALGALLVPPKQKKPATARSRKPKPAQSQHATEHLLAATASDPDDAAHQT